MNKATFPSGWGNYQKLIAAGQQLRTFLKKHNGAWAVCATEATAFLRSIRPTTLFSTGRRTGDVIFLFDKVYRTVVIRVLKYISELCD